MTTLPDDRQPPPRGNAIRRGLAFAFTAVALGLPIAGLFLMAWTVQVQRPSIAVDSVEVIGAAVASCSAGIVLASYVRRDRGTRL